MSFIRYTIDDLHKLRDSPLVRRPDGLPAIEQWMEPADQNGQRRKQQNGRAEEPHAVPEGAAQRPLFTQRHSTRNSNSEDLVLGPPATAFASSARSKGRISDVHEKNVDRQNSATFGDDLPTNDRSGNLRDRVFGGRDGERTLRERNDRNDRNNPLGRRNTREGDGEGWTPVARPRRGSQADEGDRWQRLGDRKDKEGDVTEDQSRRNGVGRGRFERSNWQRDNDQATENDTPKTGARNWRERERERDRAERGERGDREWTRGNRMPDRVDENPEWMDSPAPKEGKKQAHTQEDFERWKETMKASSRVSEEPEQPPAPAPAKENVKPAAIKLELADSIFNSWNTGPKPEAKKQPEEPLPGIGAFQIGANAKQAKAAKSSRFVGLFQKEETPPEAEPPRVTTPVAQPLNGAAKKTEDEEGFARILQMLGGTKIGNAPPQPSMAQNRQMINDLDFERKQDRTPVSSRPESAQLIEDLMSRVRGNKSRGPQTAPAESETAQQYFPSPGADYGRGHQHGRNENITPRTNGMFSPPLQQHMNNMEPRHLPDGNSRDILLSMIQQGRQQQEPEQFNFSGQRKQQGNMQHEGMPRAAPSAPPGLLDGPFPRREQEPDMQSLRKTTSRPQQQPPPGFFDGFPDDPAIMSGNHPGLTRRNTTEQQHTGRIPMSNMGIPSQQAPTDPFRGMNMPPLNNGPERNMGPPPGFGNLGGIRPPPGFQGPPPQQMPPHGVGHPGLRDPRAPQGVFGPPGMPQVGMPPPGYQTFNGPPPPQQGMPNGPPPGFGVPRDHREFMMMQQAQGLGRLPDELMGRGGRGGMPPGYM